jgi:hypothetical protein
VHAQRHGDAAVLPVLVRKAKARAQRHLCAHNAIATIEVRLLQAALGCGCERPPVSQSASPTLHWSACLNQQTLKGLSTAERCVQHRSPCGTCAWNRLCPLMRHQPGPAALP